MTKCTRIHQGTRPSCQHQCHPWIAFGSLHSVSITEPANMVYDSAHERIFVTSLSASTLYVVNVTNSSAPKIVGSVQSTSYMLRPGGLTYDSRLERCYVMDQLGATFSVVDVSAPKHPSVLGHLTDTTNFDYSDLNRLDISVVYDWRRHIAFAIGYGTHKIHAINVSDPAALYC